ncbi:hypothetical protein ACFQHO_53470 [Actinomadura yumaensis]|uniref:hypothetical protein n=1 Tax=Actinomadura yumaensis TaxID=111807 RepID=UPI003606B4DE
MHTFIQWGTSVAVAFVFVVPTCLFLGCLWENARHGGSLDLAHETQWLRRQNLVLRQRQRLLVLLLRGGTIPRRTRRELWRRWKTP